MHSSPLLLLWLVRQTLTVAQISYQPPLKLRLVIKCGKGLTTQWCEKVEFTLAVRQPQSATNFCFLSENDHTSIDEAYRNTSLDTLLVANTPLSHSFACRSFDKAGVVLHYTLRQATSVNSTFSHDCTVCMPSALLIDETNRKVLVFPTSYYTCSSNA